MDRKPYITHCFAVVVCRNIDGKWLAVKETHNRGWWLPAGAVEAGETFAQAAYRETLEVIRPFRVINGCRKLESKLISKEFFVLNTRSIQTLWLACE